jgi:UDP-glucose 4-epimerase
MRILITGGAGFIGSYLAERLLSFEDNEIYVIDDLSTGDFKNVEHLTKNERFHCIIESILNESVVEEAVKNCEIVYHLAAAVGVKLVVEQPSKTIETNILGTQIVLKMCSRYHKKVLLISTSEVYGKGMRERFNEEDDCTIGPPNKKRWSYAASKAMEEYLAFAYYYEKQLPIIIVRLFNTIGLRQRGRYGMVVPTLIKQALSNKTLTVYGDGKQTRTFLAVDDAVEALILLMKHPKTVGEVFNIGGEQEIRIEDLARLIIGLAGSSSSVKYIPYFEAYGEDFEDMSRRLPDISKINSLIGFKPKLSLEETLQKIIVFHRSNLNK